MPVDESQREPKAKVNNCELIPQLRNLSQTSKLFVALFTALMLCVVFWASWLYMTAKGEVDPEAAAILNHERYGFEDDTLAPVFDSLFTAMDNIYGNDEAIDMRQSDEVSQLRYNLGLAHTHINGQTLLFFAFGLIFLGTSIAESRKRLVLILFAAAVLIHNIGLSWMGFSSLFDDILAISGVMILLAILYMALVIFMDLMKTAKESRG
jgi:hypothetical protein